MDGNPILELLDARRIFLSPPPPKPAIIFRLAGQQICTPGNLTVIAAQAKSGKSAAVGAMLAAVLTADLGGKSVDTLGFTAAPSAGKGVIFFDTEQSTYDAWRLVHRAALRMDSELKELPLNFRCFRTNDVTTEERTDMLAAELERTKEEFGGVHCVMLDGVGDFCRDPNNTEEAFDLVEGQIKLSVKYDCPLVLVLHENPYTGKNGGGKTRGHLGSHLERKAESNLRLEKCGEHTVIYGMSCRSSAIPKSAGVKFAWNEEAQMHCTVDVEALNAAKAEETRHESKNVLSKVWGDSVGALSYKELKSKVQAITGLGESSAEKRIKAWVAERLLRQDSDRRYLRNLAFGA